MFLAISAQPIKFDSTMVDLIPGLIAGELIDVIKAGKIDVGDLIALRANDMGMGLSPHAVVAIASVAKFEFDDLAHILQRLQRFVDRGERCCRTGFVDLIIDLFRTRMGCGIGQCVQYAQALGCNSVSAKQELLSQRFKSCIYELFTLQHRV